MTKISVEKIDTFTGHRDCVYALASDDNCPNYFFSAAGDGFVVKWNLEKPDMGDLIVKTNRSIYALAFDKKENRLWIAENFEGIHIIDLDTKKEIASVKLSQNNYFDLKIFENNIFVAGGDGVISVIDMQSFAFKKHIKASEMSVRCLAINTQTNELAAGFSDHTIKIFDLSSFRLKQVIEAHDNSVFALKYSPDFQYLLSGSRDARLKIWDVSQQYQKKTEIVAHIFAINSIEFNPNGKYFATGSMDKSIKIWETANFKLIKVIDKARHAGHGTSVNELIWSKFNDYLISCSDDRTISVWKPTFFESTE